MSDGVSSSSCPILFKVLTLNVSICIIHLYLSYFLFELSSLYFEHWGQGSKFNHTRPFFTRAKSDAVWTGGLSMGHVNHSLAAFILI